MLFCRFRQELTSNEITVKTDNPWIQQLRENGVVGAGGAGFPTYAKLKTPVETYIVNGAECEPLLHKDKELLKQYADEIIEGMELVRDQVGAKEAVLGIKEKYHDVIAALQPKLRDGMRIHPLGDFYPSGDEFVLVYEVTGKIIPRGGLPLHVNVSVTNVETLLNAVWNQPVTTKFLTVAGAVAEPKTVRVPIGTPLGHVLERCGGATVDPYALLVGGVMMGHLAKNLDDPITKTTGGLLVFPEAHPLVQKYRRSDKQIKLIGKSACDQCSFCTELCPRYLLGHPIEPHKAMRNLLFDRTENSPVPGTLFCCGCNLCTLIACPEDLDPKNVTWFNKRVLLEQKYSYPSVEEIPDRPIHFMRDGRMTPLPRLMTKLGLNGFTNQGPLTEIDFDPPKVVIPMRQHVGAPAQPTVSAGTKVKAGDVIGSVAPDDLGVNIHASIQGIVLDANETHVIVEKG